MPYRSSILLLLVSLFVALSANTASACGRSKCGQNTPEKTCCATKHSNKDACGKAHSGSKGCGGHHCPCGMVVSSPSGAAIVELALLPTPISASDENTLGQAFYYARHLPEEVYAAIWQPPQLGA